MEIFSIASRIEILIEQVERNLVAHPFNVEKENEENYEKTGGIKIYHKEFMERMPHDYAILLGRFGTLQELKDTLKGERNEQLPIRHYK